MAGRAGIFAFAGPLERDQYGLFMLDVDQGTIWCYAFDNVGGTSKLRLVAARTWVYDRYLQDFNCAAPDFRAGAEAGQPAAGGKPGTAAPARAVRRKTPPGQRKVARP